MPRTALAVLEHMQSVWCRWQRWMPPRREFEKWDMEGEEGLRGAAAAHTHTLTVIQ